MLDHVPVLLQESLQYLNPTEGGFAIDGTIGGGGHAKAILERIGKNGKFLGIDMDASQVIALSDELKGRKNTILIHGNYAELPRILVEQGLGKADYLLLDLGFSSAQVDRAERGFSFMRNEPLLMTYDDSATPVRDLLKKMKEEEIFRVLKEYGEERFAKHIARAIYSRERHNPIMTTGELSETVKSAIPGVFRRHGRIHPATRTFQAFRIYANRELEHLSSLLNDLSDVLVPGGKIAVLSFHSLEDRIVKHSFRMLERQKILFVLTKKPIVPSREEIRENPRSRSAKLRVAQMALKS